MTEYKKIRESLSLSQDQFARLLGATVRTVANWDNGKNRPSHYYEREIYRLIEELKNA